VRGQSVPPAAPRRSAGSSAFTRLPRDAAPTRTPCWVGSSPPNFGVGTIVGVEGDDETDAFPSVPGRGTKKFVERYAQLEQMKQQQCCAAAALKCTLEARNPNLARRIRQVGF